MSHVGTRVSEMPTNSGTLPQPPGDTPLPLRRRLLWLLLVGLVASLLVTLVWLAGRYEASQVQGQLERDAADAVGDIRAGFSRNVQNLQALEFNRPTPAAWGSQAADLLRQRRELLRIEWLDNDLSLRAQADTPYLAPVFARLGRENSRSDVAQACTAARRVNGPAFSSSYFVSTKQGLGLEVIELCLPLVGSGKASGYFVATYSLPEVLGQFLGPQLTRGQEVSFNEADGTRLAIRGAGSRGTRVFTAQQLLDLPGITLVLRLSSWRGAPDLFPNVLTALVTAMSIALILVLALLGKDTRRRLKAERELGDAFAFRAAMENSLVTGLRARDLKGQTTYVNPAFCQMVGFSAKELLQPSLQATQPPPYWPPDLMDEYQERQAIRLAGRVPPREGFESVFMRKNGSRFPVLIIEAPLVNAQGSQTGWMSAFLDLSEQRRVQEQSRASQERLQATARLAIAGEMASLLSHELNQPLAAISSYATGSLNLLLQHQQDGLAQPGLLDQAMSQDMVQAMHRIAEQAERAGKVIKSVHDFVRRRDQAREAVPPLALFDAILPLVSLQAKKLAISVQVEVEGQLPLVFCDRTMVEQVLLNLARNAMQAMDGADVAQRILRMSVARVPGRGHANWLAFSVSDLGSGISAQVGQQLFTPFFTTKAEGMGLGLSLCRTVVEQHGGALVFGPNTPQGTVFTFTLPARTPE